MDPNIFKPLGPVGSRRVRTARPWQQQQHGDADNGDGDEPAGDEPAGGDEPVGDGLGDRLKDAGDDRWVRYGSGPSRAAAAASPYYIDKGH